MTSSIFPQSFPSKDNAQMTLSQEGHLFVLHLHHKDNRFTPEFCRSILAALQVVEDIYIAADEPPEMALVTVGNGKIFSNGLDLVYTVSYQPFMDIYFSMLKKLLTFCIPTVAALNGHAFAGGCIFALCHDYRVMRSDRGYICMNEVEFGAPLPPGMSSVLQHKLSPVTFRNMVLRAHRFNAKESLEQGLVDVAVPENEVLPKAKEVALQVAKFAKSGGSAYKQLKDQMYFEVAQQLSVPYHRLASRL
ncbi:ClpP/crotonase-like domain-containing protein [Halteromyces radiatus]|uniref:ClpP/crotonase-like domain-containing protein n=1 Tax=Halteromyces radiatus TaxID=101107 RepID=UPI00221E6024|nr:ClpP/crotonase-like domain-containing protein [Halteromyces radiatus]KAI8081305.1 ClpP/crotonase-like domain-containing protein [Halteromyces radiatus]